MSIFKKYGGRMIVAAVTIILIVIIGFTAGDRENITVAEKAIGNIVVPIERFFYSAAESISHSFNSIANFTKLKDENTKLKEQIAKLEKENREMEDVISRKEYLKNEVVLKGNTKYNYVEAKISGKDPGNWFDRFVIDKGTKDGIKKGDPVIQAVSLDGEVVSEGLVGRILEVGDNWAKVMSIIDEGSNASFKVIRTQDGGIVSGNFDSYLGGYLFDTKADVVVGDKLVTSGLGEVYLEDLYIGSIKDILKESDDLTKKISVEPAVDFKKLYKVFVIIGNNQ